MCRGQPIPGGTGDRAGPRAAGALLEQQKDLRRGVGEVATTHHSFLGSFSTVSKRNFAIRHAFCSNFQNLQNCLADFLKILTKFSKYMRIFQYFPKENIDSICRSHKDLQRAATKTYRQPNSLNLHTACWTRVVNTVLRWIRGQHSFLSFSVSFPYVRFSTG